MTSFFSPFFPRVPARLTMSLSASSGGVLANNESSGPVLNSLPTNRHRIFGLFMSPLFTSIHFVPMTLPPVCSCSDRGTRSYTFISLKKPISTARPSRTSPGSSAAPDTSSDAYSTPFCTYNVLMPSTNIRSPTLSSGLASTPCPSNSCTLSTQCSGQSPFGRIAPPDLRERNLPVASPFSSTSICMPLKSNSPDSLTISGG